MIHVRPQTWDAICHHAQETFPEECCGAILNHADVEEVHRITNVQNILHAKDPQRYPRDAATAYVGDSRELLRLNEEMESGKVSLKAFYHSHPNHDAYFSNEDKLQAMGWDNEPSYPGAAHLVISIYEREVRVIRAYVWDELSKDFVEAPLSTDV
jgi:proteasome lid subunit RPN8/RPN11